MSLKAAELPRFADDVWDQSIVPAAVRVRAHPEQVAAVRSGLGEAWPHGARSRSSWPSGAGASRSRDCRVAHRAACPGRTPLIFIEVPRRAPGRHVLLYGHLDKQPEFTGWHEGLGPWEPVIRDGRLYGRGAADDGYAMFSSLTAIAALKAQQVPHARCVVLIEACEESGSVGSCRRTSRHSRAASAAPSLVVCLDAEAGDYEQAVAHHARCAETSSVR